MTLLGDSAHPMYPVGSNGASQAVLDSRALAKHLASATNTQSALKAYEDERLGTTTEIVHQNRGGGPERVIDVIEARAPDGFDRAFLLFDAATLDAARATWRSLDGEDALERSYFAQEDGRWVKKA